MRKSSKWLLVGLACTVMALSITALLALRGNAYGQNETVKTRIRQSRQESEKFIRQHPTDYKSEVESTILRALNDATPQTLASPQIVSAAIGSKKSKLHVIWIAAQPRVDHVEVVDDKAGVALTLAIPEVYRKENDREGREGVVYQFVLDLVEDSHGSWPADKGLAPGMKVRLVLRDRQSEAAPILFRTAPTLPVQ